MSLARKLASGLSDEDTATQLIASLPFAMVIADPHRDDCPIVYVNRAFESVTGYSARFAIGKNCRFLQGDNRDQEARFTLRQAIENREPATVDIVNYRANGEEFINRLMIAPVRDEDGRLFAFIGVQTEINEAEAANSITADEATKMLEETQHRVKNHLSMVASMIRLQSAEEDAVTTYELLARRVEALSLLYDEFTTSVVPPESRYDVVSAGGYISRVASTISALDGRKSVRVNVDTDIVPMRTDDAARLGLLASEIMSNTLQHAFEGRTEGMAEIALKATSSDRVRLVVSDDGVGLGDSDWPNEGNLGAKIVRGLVQSLRADLSIKTSGSGTTVTVEFGYALPTQIEGDGERAVVTDERDTDTDR